MMRWSLRRHRRRDQRPAPGALRLDPVRPELEPAPSGGYPADAPGFTPGGHRAGAGREPAPGNRGPDNHGPDSYRPGTYGHDNHGPGTRGPDGYRSQDNHGRGSHGPDGYDRRPDGARPNGARPDGYGPGHAADWAADRAADRSADRAVGRPNGARPGFPPRDLPGPGAGIADPFQAGQRPGGPGASLAPGTLADGTLTSGALVPGALVPGALAAQTLVTGSLADGGGAWPEVMERFGLHLLTLAEQLRMSLDELETDEGDPDRLQKLYRVDHAVTRMRRASRDLRTLAGRGEEELSGTDTPLLDVIRVALSAIERYTQVTIGRVADFGVLGYAADDVASLLAALLDNATRYSPGATSISAHLTEGGSVLFRISDSGIGMDPDGVAALNAMLAGDVPGPDDRTARHTGFPVVHRIARKHSIGVRLAARPSPGSGTIALVTVPPELMCELPDEAPRHLASSPAGGPGARASKTRASEARASETWASEARVPGARAPEARVPEASVSVLRTARRIPSEPPAPPSGTAYQPAAGAADTLGTADAFDTPGTVGSADTGGTADTAGTADGERTPLDQARADQMQAGLTQAGLTQTGLPRRERASLRGTGTRSGSGPGSRSGQAGGPGPEGGSRREGSSSREGGPGDAGQPSAPSAEQIAAARHTFADDLTAFSLGSSGVPTPQAQAVPQTQAGPPAHGGSQTQADPENQDPGQGAPS